MSFSAAPSGVSNEKYCVASGGLASLSATIQGVERVLVGPTLALCFACWIGSSPAVSAPTFVSHCCIAMPFGNVAPLGRVVSMTALVAGMLFDPGVQVARFA